MRSGDKFDAESYLQYAGPVGDLARNVLKKLDPKPGEIILDIGCGDGTVTKIIAQSGAVVHGIDANEGMIREAFKKGLVHVSVQDSHNLKYQDDQFDKIFSNSAFHWMDNLASVFRECGRVLKDGGKLVAEFGMKVPPYIEKAVVEVAREHRHRVKGKNPWHDNGPIKLKRMLNNTGFEDINIKTGSRLQSIGDMKGWLDNFVADTYLKDIPSDKKEVILNQIVERLDNFPNRFAVGEEKEWFGDYQRISVTASLNKEKLKTMVSIRGPEAGTPGDHFVIR